MHTIKRVTNLQKRIINQILEDGLTAYWYNDEVWTDTADKFDVTEDEVRACLNYVQDKLMFANC